MTKTCKNDGCTTSAGARERAVESPTFQPRVDVVEHPDRLVLLFDVPGADEKTLHVELEDRSLTISAELESSPPEGLTLLHREYSTGSYTRRFCLPAEVERDAIEARYENGVLTVTVPKAKAPEPRRIQVTTL